MGLGTNQVTISVAGNFIPEMWSDEVVAVYKNKLVLGNLVTRISFKGKKGDTLHLPVPARGDPSAKATNTQVTLLASTNSAIDVLIDKHYEYSKLYEDMAEMQSLASMRNFYTADAGYALAKRIDKHLHLLCATLNCGPRSGTGSTSHSTGALSGYGCSMFSLSAGSGVGWGMRG